MKVGCVRRLTRPGSYMGCIVTPPLRFLSRHFGSRTLRGQHTSHCDFLVPADCAHRLLSLSTLSWLNPFVVGGQESEGGGSALGAPQARGRAYDHRLWLPLGLTVADRGPGPAQLALPPPSPSGGFPFLPGWGLFGGGLAWRSIPSPSPGLRFPPPSWAHPFPHGRALRTLP